MTYPSLCPYSRSDFPRQPGAPWVWSCTQACPHMCFPRLTAAPLPGPACSPSVPGVGVLPVSCPAPAQPPCSAAGTASLYIMLTVEITSRLLFYTAPCQISPQPSDQDKLNTILAMSIFIPFYKRGWMGGRNPLRCQRSKAPEGCPPSQWITISLFPSRPCLLDFP